MGIKNLIQTSRDFNFTKLSEVELFELRLILVDQYFFSHRKQNLCFRCNFLLWPENFFGLGVMAHFIMRFLFCHRGVGQEEGCFYFENASSPVSPAVRIGRPKTTMTLRRALSLSELTHLAISSRVSWRLETSVMLKFRSVKSPVKKFGIV